MTKSITYHPNSMPRHHTQVSQLLESWNQGDPQALETLMPLVIDDLRSIARHHFEHEDPDNTLQPTALVNELYLRLMDQRQVSWESPRHFFGAAARIMRRLLVDHARHRRAAKRGGGTTKLAVDDNLPELTRHDPEEILALDEALERLEALEPRQSQVVALKSFVGLTTQEIAQALGIGRTAVKSDWRFARAWLERELRAGA